MPDANRNFYSRLIFRDRSPAPADASSEILAGLGTLPRQIAPKYFYDHVGSELFVRITGLPEYYLTRSERSILTSNAEAIARRLGTGSIVIEPGSGDSTKIRVLLEHLRPTVYVPVEISSEILEQSAYALASNYPWLNVYAICADCHSEDGLPDDLPDGRRIAFYPGSSIGNLEPAEAKTFLRRIRKLIGRDGGLLIGFDLVKERQVLEAAYNDSQAITEAFNKNSLLNIGRHLNANFDPAEFDHLAFFNEQESRIEMHLVSRRAQTITHDKGEFEFSAGERIHTENSYKYTQESFADMAAAAGFTVRASWTDERNFFCLAYLEPSDKN